MILFSSVSQQPQLHHLYFLLQHNLPQLQHYYQFDNFQLLLHLLQYIPYLQLSEIHFGNHHSSDQL